MKRKFSTILAVGLSLVLALALGMPVLADVSSATVDVEDEELNTATDYIITFDVIDEVPNDDTGWIEVRFPDDTIVADFGVDNVTVQSTAGFGDRNPEASIPTSNVTETEDKDDIWTVRILTVSLAKPIGEDASVRVKLAGKRITNPSEPGFYTLEVRTSEEDDWVESASYEIEARVLAGGINVYNAEDSKMAFVTDLAEAVAEVTGNDWTIIVGEGTFQLDADLDLVGDGLTLKSSGGAEDTIIDCNEDYGIIISEDDVTIDGFTINDATVGITIGSSTGNADDAVIKNCFIKDADKSGPGILISDNATDVIIEDNSFDDCPVAIELASGASDATISDNEITGCTDDTEGAIVFSGGNDDNTISGNTITANDGSGIYFATGDNSTDNLIEGNTISTNEENGIEIATVNLIELLITGNDISDNEEVGILIGSWHTTSAITNNSISQEDAIETDVDVDVDATFNWWGTTDDDDIADMISDDGDGDTVYEPFLTGLADAVFTGSNIALDASSLDAKDEAGVKVSGVEDEETPANVADVIKAAKYVDNPEEDIAGAVAFFDVYILLSEDWESDEDITIKLKFYDVAIDEYALAYMWTGDYWAECSDQEAQSGIVRVNVTEDTTYPTFEELEATPFAVVAGAADAAEYTCPQCGLTFTTAAALKAHWEDVHKPAPPVAPVITVQAPPAPVVTVQAPPPAEITVTVPDITVEAPTITVEAAPAPAVTVEAPSAAAAPAVPSYMLWMIIGIGAVLVIALIVLIVRTRRVA